MFEKEAEEYLKKDGTKAEQILNMLNEISPLKMTLKQLPFMLAMIQQIFKDGAEFGYNKANEWQYVSEKGTPKTEGHYLVCLRNKDKDILDCWILYDKDVGWYSMQIRIKDIYAWKEIMPPELPKESAE